MAQINLPKGFVTLVDDDRFKELSAFKWHATPRHTKHRKYWYVMSNGILMHRLITNAPTGMVVDHINGVTLDNRIANLRVCTNAENIRNREKQCSAKTSRFKGVWKARSKWESGVECNHKVIRLGTFSTEIEAALAYDAAAARLHGEFARLNFPQNAGQQVSDVFHDSNFCPEGFANPSQLS